MEEVGSDGCHMLLVDHMVHLKLRIHFAVFPWIQNPESVVEVRKDPQRFIKSLHNSLVHHCIPLKPIRGEAVY